MAEVSNKPLCEDRRGNRLPERGGKGSRTVERMLPSGHCKQGGGVHAVAFAPTHWLRSLLQPKGIQSKTWSRGMQVTYRHQEHQASAVERRSSTRNSARIGATM